MHITYDNIIYSLQKSGGVSVYWSELSNRLAIEENITIDFYEYPNKNTLRSKGIFTIRESLIPPIIARYLPFIKKLPKEGIFHSSYYRFTRQKNIINVTTVHDFTYEKLFSGLKKHIHKNQKYAALKKADGIICVSENTRKDMLEYYPELSKKNIKVIYNGVSNSFYPISSKETKFYDFYSTIRNKEYILYVGGRSHYKNFPICIDVINNQHNLNLIFIGGGPISTHEKHLLDQINGRFLHIESPNSDELNILYNNAFCLLYPSSYEGFGIPIIEAMKSGCPVVALNRSSIPEISGNSALLTEEANYKLFIDKIELLRDPLLRKNITNKGFENSQRFSWDLCFHETMKFYCELYKTK